MKWLNDLPKKFLLPCKEVMPLCSRELDGKLTAGERFKIWAHCLYCLCCRRFRKQVGWMRGAMRGLGEAPERIGEGGDAGGCGLDAGAKARLQAAMEKEGGGGEKDGEGV